MPNPVFRRMRAAGIVLVATLYVIPAASAQNASSTAALPDGLSFAGLIEDVWHIHIVRDGATQVIAEAKHPRTFSYHKGKVKGSGRLAYIGSDAKLRLLELDQGAEARELETRPDSRYTQPSFSADGRWLLAVELPDGKSRRTNIIGYDMESGERHRFVAKRTAQFEPAMGSERYLHYSTAICVDDCGGMIWELWRRDMFTGKQQQLTLLNVIANQPHVRGDDIYFSANADGGRFHIWKMKDEIGAEPEQLTIGDVRDSDPTTDDAGNLYFLRATPDGTALMRIAASTDHAEDADAKLGRAEEVALDATITDLRNLEISR